MAAKAPATTIRLDSKLRPQVDAFALETRRSLNGSVNWLVAFALEVLSERASQAK